MAPRSAVLTEDQINVSHVPRDCEMQIHMERIGLDNIALSLDEMLKVASLIGARGDVVSAKVSNLTWLKVKYNPASLGPGKRTTVEKRLTQKIQQAICNTVNHRKKIHA